MKVTGLSLLLLLFFIGCGDETASNPTDNAVTSEIEIGCQHLTYGPDVSLDLASEVGAASTIHTRYTVQLATADSGTSGSFAWTSAGGHHYFLFNHATTVTVTQDGTEVASLMAHTAPVSGCADAASVYEYMLPQGGYEVAIASSEPEVFMAIHKAGQTHDHGQHHGDEHGNHHGEEHGDHQGDDHDGDEHDH